MRAIKTVRKNINFPQDLIPIVYSLSSELKIDFSKFVREAIKHYVKTLKREKMARELEEEALANNGFYEKLRKEYKKIDSEAWR